MCFLFVKIFCCCVHFVSKETRKHAVLRQRQRQKWKFKEQHAKTWENIAGAKRYSRPRGFDIAGASAPVAPVVPTPLRCLAVTTVRREVAPQTHGDSMRVWVCREA